MGWRARETVTKRERKRERIGVGREKEFKKERDLLLKNYTFPCQRKGSIISLEFAKKKYNFFGIQVNY